MLSDVLNGGMSPLLKQLAVFTERRQEVLAGNIANIDTPGYRMRDLPVAEFRQAMEAALSRVKETRNQSNGLPSNPQAPEALLGAQPADEAFSPNLFQARTAPSQPGITFQDANNRSIENQMLQMTQNALLQNVAMQLLTAQYAQLEAAISERA